MSLSDPARIFLFNLTMLLSFIVLTWRVICGKSLISVYPLAFDAAIDGDPV